MYALLCANKFDSLIRHLKLDKTTLLFLYQIALLNEYRLAIAIYGNSFINIFQDIQEITHYFKLLNFRYLEKKHDNNLPHPWIDSMISLNENKLMINHQSNN